MKPTQEKQRGIFLAALSVIMFLVVMAYLFGVTFVAMPTTGIKYADIAVPLLLGTVIGGVVGYWLGGTNKPEPPVKPVEVPPAEPPAEEPKQ